MKEKKMGNRVTAGLLSVFLAVCGLLSPTVTLTFAKVPDALESTEEGENLEELAELTGVKITGIDEVYSKEAFPAVKIEGIDPKKDRVFYQFEGGEICEEMPKVTEAGEYRLIVTVKREGYKDYQETVVSQVRKADLSLEVTACKKDYDGKMSDGVAVKGLEDGDQISYEINGEPANSLPQIENVGTYRIAIKVHRNENYNDYNEEVTAEVRAVEIDGLSAELYFGVYDGEAHNAVTKLTGTKDGDQIEYKLGDGDWETTPPQITDAGSYTIQIRVNRLNHMETVIELNPAEAVIQKAERNLQFKSPPKDAMTVYDPETEQIFDFSAEGEGAGNYTVIYRAVNDAKGEPEEADHIAVIDDTGKLTLKGPGVLKITAEVKGDKNYQDAVAAYGLAVQEKEGSLSFDEDIVEAVLGKDMAVGQILAARPGDNGTVSYRCEIEGVADNKEIGLNMDSASGTLSVTDCVKLAKAMEQKGDSLTATVTARKTEGAVIQGMTDKTVVIFPKIERISYQVKLLFAELPKGDKAYRFMDPDGKELNEPNGANGWYQTDIRVEPADGSYRIAKDKPEDFRAETVLAKQGETDVVFYLQDQEGGITKPVKISGIKIDGEKPDSARISIEYSESFLDKVIEGLTFGFYQSTVDVIFTAYDPTSGIDKFVWSYEKQEGASEENEASYENEELAAIQSEEDSTKYTASVTLPKDSAQQLRGYLSLKAIDRAGNNSDIKTDDGHIIVVDTISPAKTVSYQLVDADKEMNGNYFSGDVQFTFEIKEGNFFQEDVHVSVSKNGNQADEISLDWSKTEGKDGYSAEYALEDEGDYVVTVEYADRSGNVMEAYESPVITIDKTAPDLEIRYLDAKDETDPQSVEITVKEHNFDPSFVDIIVDQAEDINGNSVEFADFASYFKEESNWKTKGETHTAVLSEIADANYEWTVKYKDLALNPACDVSLDFCVDHKAPEADRMEISYSNPVSSKLDGQVSYKYYKDSVELTFTAYDEISGIDYFTYSYIKEEGASQINRPVYIEEKLDAAQDQLDHSKYTASVMLPKDEADQLRGNIIYSAVDNSGNHSESKTDTDDILVRDTISPEISVAYSAADQIVGNRSYYSKDILVMLTVTEANFYAEDVEMKLSKDGQTPYSVSRDIVWSDENPDKHMGIYRICVSEDAAADGEYTVEISYTDRSGNASGRYKSDIMVIDTVDPVIDFSYLDYSDQESPQTAIIAITEHNFRVEDIKVETDAKDRNGKDVFAEDLEAYLKSCDWETNGDAHTVKLSPADKLRDAIYRLKITYTDLAMRKTVKETEEFIVDTQAPQEDSLKIEYSTPLTEKVKQMITFGYYNPSVTVTFTAKDSISGVRSFTYSYLRENGASEQNKAEYAQEEVSANQDAKDRSLFRASVTLPKEEAVQLRGSVGCFATDRHGNQTQKQTDDKTVIVVDTIKPEVAEFEYSNPSQMVGNARYYNGKASVIFTVTEANFYQEDVEIMVAKNEGTPYSVSEDVVWTDVSADCHAGVYTFLAPSDHSKDGDYKIKLSYTDRSKNKMEVYQSDRITIDTVDPVIDFTYTDDTSEISPQTAVIAITEQNFDKRGITVQADIRDVNGTAVEAADLQEYLRSCFWETKGDVHTAKISAKNPLIDGIYRLTIDYEDLATRRAKTKETGSFIIDTTSPDVKTMSVEYAVPFYETLIETVTFGYYKPSVTIKFTAYDNVSGISSFTYAYQKQSGASNTNVSAYQEELAAAVRDSEDMSKFTASVTLPKKEADQLRGHITFFAEDWYGNRSEEITDTNHVVVRDTISPELSVAYSAADQKIGGRSYYNKDVTLTFTVTEANFYAEDVKIRLSKDGDTPQPIDESVVWSEVSPDKHVGIYELLALEDGSSDGEYKVYVSYRDRSGNQMDDYISDTIIIDTIDPVISFRYAGYADSRQPQTATVTITERNFRAEDLKVKTSAKDIKGNAAAAKDLEFYLQNYNWVSKGDVHTAMLSADDILEDAIYNLKFTYTDLSMRKAEKESGEFIVDTAAPVQDSLKIKYSEPIFETLLSIVTFGYYNPSVTVTFEANDMTSGIASFTYSYRKEEGASSQNLLEYAESSIPAKQDNDDRSLFTASVQLPKEEAAQLRGSVACFATDRHENKCEKITDSGTVIVVDTIQPELASFEYAVPAQTVGTNLYYKEKAAVTFRITEANFYREDVRVTVKKNGGAPYSVADKVVWTDVSADEHVGVYTFQAPKDHSGDGHYVMELSYTDRSGNKMPQYQSDTITIDTVDPVIEFVYSDYSHRLNPQTAVITVKEHNFRQSDIRVRADVRDITGAAVKANNLEQYLKNCVWTKKGDAYTAVISADDMLFDGIYQLTIDYTDLAMRQAGTKSVHFVVDTQAPDSKRMEVDYSVPIWKTLVSAVTFGYYKPSVTLTFTAYDMGSGVDYFTYSYRKENGASKTNVAAYGEDRVAATQDLANLSKYTAVVTLPKETADQLRGSVTFTATDHYGNKSSAVTDSGTIFVVDTISPAMEVSYNEPNRTADSVRYYNKSVTAEFTVRESNFYKEDIKVTLSKDGEKPVSLKLDWKKASEDVYVGAYKIKAPENHSKDGDYVFSVTYTDRSGNQMKKYKSKTITIDTIRPKIKVEYGNKNAVWTDTDEDGTKRGYYDDVQTAVVTITEHNFKAKDVNFSVTAKDVTQKALDASGLYTKSPWKEDGDDHTVTLTFSEDANYEFDVDYTDLADNQAKNYPKDSFTVDRTVPKELQVSYSEPVLETLLEMISFGFYEAKTTVTLTAEDETSGVSGFQYSYRNASGVSPVNAELLDQAIKESELSYSFGGRQAKAAFDIPGSALDNGTQFNGTVDFTALDRSGNESSSLEDEQRIVVDTISPTAEVEYSSPVQTMNGIAYYDNDVTASVTVNEANFYPEDVTVSVTRDNAAYPVAPSWSDSSADIHIGTFTLSGDGDYQVAISYTDKSNNAMAEYTSEQITIDTEIAEPAIQINGEEADGKAFKGDVILGVEFEDENFLDYEIELLRTRFYEKEADVTKQFIGDKLRTSSLGVSGTVDTFEKIAENDGIYKLTVSMKDKAGHSKEAQTTFTVNRFGSVYAYNDYLSSLIEGGGAYVQSVSEDLKITEYNADRLLADSLDIAVFRDGKPLSDVKLEALPELNPKVEVGESGWYQYEYRLKKENFASDGIYKISVSSKDEAGNSPETINSKGKGILFRVDKTAPEINSITGLEESIVNAENVEAGYTVYDTIGLKSVGIYIDDKKVDFISDFSEDPNYYEGSFQIGESNSSQNVRLVVSDMAGNVTNTGAKDYKSVFKFYGNVTVSTNLFVRLFADERVVFGGAAGISILAAGGGYFFVKRKRRKI